MTEPQPGTPEAALEPQSFWRRWGWRILLSVLIATAALGWYASRRGQVAGFVILPDTGKDGPFKLVVYLPGLGSLESFRQDQAPAREICRKLALPDFPDISSLDPTGQLQFHVAMTNLRIMPKDHDRYGELGQVYESQKFPELAVQLYRRAIEMAPGDYEWHYALALRLAQDGESERAEVEFRQASELHPDYAPVWMRRAWHAVEQGNMEASLGLIGRYIQLRPDEPFGYVQRARVQRDMEQWDEMQASLDKAASLGPIGKGGHRLLSELCRHRGQPDDAEFHSLMAAHGPAGVDMDDPIERKVRGLETVREPLFKEFTTLFVTGRYEEATRLAEQVCEKAKGRWDFGDYCGKIAEAYHKLDNTPKALFYAQEAQRAMPDKAAPYAEIAAILVSMRQYQAAVDEADKALEIDSAMDAALAARGVARIRLAVQQMNLPPEFRQEDPKAIVLMAVQDLEESRDKNPVNHAYLTALATAHGMLEHYDKANELLAVALRVQKYEHAIDPTTLSLKAKAETRQSFWPASPTGR